MATVGRYYAKSGDHQAVHFHCDLRKHTMQDTVQVLPAVFLPGNPSTPCPELLTEEEAIRYLRLDTTDVKDPSLSLRYYREKGLLRGTKVGRRTRYRRIELERFLERLTEANPR